VANIDRVTEEAQPPARRRSPLTKLALSIVTIAAAAGLMGTATYGAFDNQHNRVTPWVRAPAVP
jgi:hypothetical protein